MSRLPVLLTLVIAILTTVPNGALGAGLAPQGAVLNGSFELFDDPTMSTKCLAFGEGYVNVFEPGSGLPWLIASRPCNRSATSWSNSAATRVQNVGGDRAAVITPGVSDPVLGANHNLWQVLGNANHAYTGNFDALRFDLESGTFPTGASVIISFSTTPLETLNPWVGIFVECQLSFRLVHFESDGVARIADPTKAAFSSRFADCDEAAAEWTSADSEGRRDILGRLRIVQLSFWSFNTGSGPVVIDNVQLVGATTFVEEAVRQA